MTAKRAIVFDRDGVLTRFDFVPVLELFRAMNIDLGAARSRWDAWCARRVRVDTAEVEHAHLQGFWEDLAEAFHIEPDGLARLRAFDYTSTIRAFDDAKPALEAARRLGFGVAVLSNFPLATIDRSLRAVGLADLIDRAFAAPVIGFAKPAPQAYRHVLDALEVAPGDAFFVDDEEPCVEGARAVGMRAFLLARDGDREAHPGSFGVVRSLDELVRIAERAPA